MTVYHETMTTGYFLMLRFRNFIETFVTSLTKRLFSSRQPLDIYRVMKYDSCSDAETDLTTTYLRGEPLRYTDTEYLEFRIQWKAETFRYIVNADHPDYPNYRDFAVKPQLQIVKAMLINSTDAIYEDVTDRVRKFTGPSTPAFFGRQLTCAHLFRNDDLTEDHTLCIVHKLGPLFRFKQFEVIDLNNI